MNESGSGFAGSANPSQRWYGSADQRAVPQQTYMPRGGRQACVVPVPAAGTAVVRRGATMPVARPPSAMSRNPIGLEVGQRRHVGRDGPATQMVKVSRPGFAPRELVATGSRVVAPQPETGFTAPHEDEGVTGFAGNTVAFVGASGGVGVSVISSLVALQCVDEGWDCALVDGDFDGGGLDVLLGLENDKGLRFSTLNAPLGRVDGHAISARLPRWRGIPVLASDPWNGTRPEWWETSAALTGLAEVNDIVILDAGRGHLLTQLPGSQGMDKVIVTELSVLGLIRAKSLLSHYSSAKERDDGSGVLAVLGVQPRGTSHGRGVVNVGEAASFLGREVLGPLAPDAHRASDILEGMGVRGVGRAERPVLKKLCACLSKGRKGGGRP